MFAPSDSFYSCCEQCGFFSHAFQFYTQSIEDLVTTERIQTSNKLRRPVSTSTKIYSRHYHVLSTFLRLNWIDLVTHNATVATTLIHSLIIQQSISVSTDTLFMHEIIHDCRCESCSCWILIWRIFWTMYVV